MRRLVLTRSVHIVGRDFWGRKAQVVLEPTKAQGWFWRVGTCDVPIGPDLVCLAGRRLTLRYKNEELDVFEHLGALRAFGLDNVRIVARTSWLPYDGRAQLYVYRLLPHLCEEGTLVPMTKRVHGVVEHCDSITRRLTVTLGVGEVLTVTIRVSYPLWGEHILVRVFPGGKWIDVAVAKPLARPSWLQSIAQGASAFGWPHYNNVLWPHGRKPDDILRELALHRILDLFGAISTLLAPGEYLTGNVEADCANHAVDVAFLRQVIDCKREGI